MLPIGPILGGALRGGIARGGIRGALRGVARAARKVARKVGDVVEDVVEEWAEPDEFQSPDSSCIAGAKYAVGGSGGVVTVYFQEDVGGGSESYAVAPGVWTAFKFASSKGAFFNRHIKR